MIEAWIERLSPAIAVLDDLAAGTFKIVQFMARHSEYFVPAALILGLYAYFSNLSIRRNEYGDKANRQRNILANKGGGVIIAFVIFILFLVGSLELSSSSSKEESGTAEVGATQVGSERKEESTHKYSLPEKPNPK